MYVIINVVVVVLVATIIVDSIYCQFHVKLLLNRINHKYLYVITSNLKSCLLLLFVKSIIEFLNSSPFSLFSYFSRFVFTTLSYGCFVLTSHTLHSLLLILALGLCKMKSALNNLALTGTHSRSLSHTHTSTQSLTRSLGRSYFCHYLSQIFFVTISRACIHFILL